jgi:hypothetical protein
MGGWMTSLERTVPAAVGQFSSNCPRVTAVRTAIDSLLSRNWAGVAHPGATIAVPTTRNANDLAIT